MTRKQAKEQGLTRYFTGKPCMYGHISERYVCGKTCIRCKRIYMDKHPEYRSERNYARENAQVYKKMRQNIPYYLLKSAKYRAKVNNIEINLTTEDIIIPQRCPILGIEMMVNDNKPADNSFSLDRIDYSKGYIKGNVEVISHRANALKRNGSLTEFRMILEYMRNNIK